MANELKFFTNEPERDLYSKFQTLLRGDINFFDVIVGYFRTSGFFLMCDALNEVEKIRILVGLNVDKRTVEILSDAEKFAGIFSTIQNAKEKFSKSVKAEFDDSEIAFEVEYGVKKFLEWLNTGKLELRIYTAAPLHAKVYVMRSAEDKITEKIDSVITGSSNFSEAGLVNNLEFNVELKDFDDVKFAYNKFEELWKLGEPVNDEYIEVIQNQTWLRNNITPYEIYLKTLYEFFKEEINSDQELDFENYLPENFVRLQYQSDAVTQAKKILESYGGVFISDVVGLGKTYICAMLAQRLEKGRKLIICPPVLVKQWKDVLLKFNIAAKVESLGKLDKVIDDGIEQFQYIFVDESHRFRSEKTESFSKLHKICFGKKVILISATPINNYSTDIESQISLFQSKHNSTIAGVRDLEKFFANLTKKAKNFDKSTPEYLNQLAKNSKEIRDKILRYIMIRRTRNEISKYYSDDLQKNGVTFPKLGTPEAVNYEFDDKIDKIFTDTVTAIKKFKYARYMPLKYLPPSKKYSKMQTAQRNLGGFMKSILVKRLESSFFAFQNTLRRFEESYQKFITMFASGEVYISKQVDVYELLNNGDEEELLQLVEEDKAMHFQSSEFSNQFSVDLQSDLKTLQNLRQMWEKVTYDPKLNKLKEELQHNKIFQDNKKIIFTESKETAEYLYRELKKVYGDRIIIFTGGSSEGLKRKIERSFDPAFAQEKDEFDLLITTDVLAEGVNLHRANSLINYDLPWNPTRIMQRVGRINRVGTKHAEIFIFNFFPTSATKKHLSLEDRILEKLQLFHETLGEDFKYLSESEEVSPKSLFDTLNANLSGEDDDINPELEYLKIIREVRDNKKDLFDKIKHLPKKARTGKFSAEVEGEATLTFARSGALKTFFLTDSETQQLTFLDAIKFLRCEPEEKQIEIGEKFFDQYKINCTEFKNLLDENEADMFNSRTPPSVKKIIKNLKALKSYPDFTDDQEEIIQRIIFALNQGDIPARDIQKINQAVTTEKNPVLLLKKIYDIINKQSLYGRQQAENLTKQQRQVILSCSLKGS